ncbi:MAG TPA: phytanoyl-CoA dioxygenase family protein [Stellaceae bacterium]|nr:phytanoyl-CoA dioxygenase family protein [Stellaceae bacterium]
MISERDVELYRERGYVVVPDLLDTQTLSAARQVIAEVVEGARGVARHTEIYDLEPSHRPDAPRVRRIKTPHLHHELFRRIMRTPRMIEILQQLLGPAVRLHGSKLNMKAPHYGSPVEWHQDWAFYPHTNDDMLAVGIMLDDCALENGPLMVMPGTHKGPVYDHHANGYFCGAIDPTTCDLDFSQAVPLTGSAGTMSFHHVRLVHGSAQNVSALSRQLLLYEFSAADAFPVSRPVTDLAAYDANLVAGGSTVTPRLAAVPVRMPLPPAPRQGSIYENQTTTRARYFAFEPGPALVE